MDLPDVNVLIYAIDASFKKHEAYRAWLHELTNCGQPFAMAEAVLRSFIRISTNPKILDSPLSIDKAVDYTDRLTGRPCCMFIQSGRRHWQAFTDLCRQSAATGNDVPDAYLAAIAIEYDFELVTADRRFRKFPGLRWRHPVDD